MVWLIINLILPIIAGTYSAKFIPISYYKGLLAQNKLAKSLAFITLILYLLKAVAKHLKLKPKGFTGLVRLKNENQRKMIEKTREVDYKYTNKSSFSSEVTSF